MKNTLRSALFALLIPLSAGGCGSPPPDTDSVETATTGTVGWRVADPPVVPDAVPRDQGDGQDVFEPVWLKAPRELEIRQGGRRDFQVVVERRGFAVPVYFRCDNLPAGVRLLGTPRISVDGDRMLLSLVAAPDAPRGHRVFRIVATAVDGSVLGARFVRLTVRK